MSRHWQLIFICLLVLWPDFSFADQLVFRATDTHGKPLAGNTVIATWLYAEGRKERVEMKTDPNGEARIVVPSQVPTQVTISVVPKVGQHWRCNWRGTCGISIAPVDAFRNGIAFYEMQKRASLKATPGQILFIARPWTLWQYLIGPLAS